jgi:transcriptional regulator with XRE-family HTH domain
MERILENIEAIRKEKGLKQSDMARELNVSQSAYSNIITRNTDIYLGKLSQIADILGVSVIDIITYPKKYVDVDQIALESTTGKVAVMFEVSPSRRDSLIKMVIEDKNK